MEIECKAPHLARAENQLDQLRHWVIDRDDIRALAIVGSYARGDARPDSDLDVVLLTNHPSRYIENTNWVSTFGKTETVDVEPYGRATSIRALYDTGLELELSIAPSNWAAEPLDAGTAQVVRNGIVVLFDRDGQATALAALVSPSP